MKDRCNNKNAPHYEYYGGRGIKVCKEWESDYIKFKEWAVSNGYKDGLTIERVDCNKWYCPDNCIWIEKYRQSSNRRNNHNILYQNELWTTVQLAKHFGVNRRTVSRHLKKCDWGMVDIDYESKFNYKVHES